MLIDDDEYGLLYTIDVQFKIHIKVTDTLNNNVVLWDRDQIQHSYAFDIQIIRN